MRNYFSNVTTDDVVKVAFAAAAVIGAVGYFIRAVKK